ncbi:MAG: OmpA family protein [Elusimicrobiota bacterium]|jgi:peptidoglycan-associated lipoprotein|nr:OmpA family protein [Elusimicrobiota bacterium]
MKNLIKFALVFAFAAGLAACSKNVKNQPVADSAAGKGSVPEITAEEIAVFEDDDAVYGVGVISDVSVTLAPVYFALDQYTLTKENRAVLDANVEVLKARGINAITVEGNCDERGTISYNIALGDKRAKEVKDYYIKRGINANNIKTISYGEEKPVCFDRNETCWAQNRKADTIVK